MRLEMRKFEDGDVERVAAALEDAWGFAPRNEGNGVFSTEEEDDEFVTGRHVSRAEAIAEALAAAAPGADFDFAGIVDDEFHSGTPQPFEMARDGGKWKERVSEWSATTRGGFRGHRGLPRDVRNPSVTEDDRDAWKRNGAGGIVVANGAVHGSRDELERAEVVFGDDGIPRP